METRAKHTVLRCSPTSATILGTVRIAAPLVQSTNFKSVQLMKVNVYIRWGVSHYWTISFHINLIKELWHYLDIMIS